jgi:hypothetical protein
LLEVVLVQDRINLVMAAAEVVEFWLLRTTLSMQVLLSL